jgi:hypothetical protein
MKQLANRLSWKIPAKSLVMAARALNLVTIMVKPRFTIPDHQVVRKARSRSLASRLTMKRVRLLN